MASRRRPPATSKPSKTRPAHAEQPPPGIRQKRGPPNAIVLPAGSPSFSVTALQPGAAGNAPAGVFSQHNFTNYAGASFGSLLVTNRFGVIGGRDAEDDESYRYRIHLKLQSQSGINEAALRYGLLQLPGVQDVVFSPFAGGFYCYLYGVSPVVAPSLLELANDRIHQIAADPITGSALTPDLVGISLQTSVALAAGVSPASASIVISAAVNAVQNYVNNLAIGAPLVIHEIASRSATRQPDRRRRAEVIHG